MRLFIIVITFIFAVPTFAQTTTIITQKPKDTIKNKPASDWVRTNEVGFDLSEIAFINWSPGGVSSISALAKGKFTRIKRTSNTKFSNELLVRYGLNKQEKTELRKTDDELKFMSTYGYKADSLSNWYHSAKFNFNTQFTNGYAYPNTEVAVSKSFAPAYTFFGIGAEYSAPEDKVNVYLSPLTMKNTFVLSQRLANQGAFGVQAAVRDSITNEVIRKGKLSRTEIGILTTANIKRQIFENISAETRISLYTDYINNFGNIDVDWQLTVDFIVNEYVKANIGLHMVYDDDVKAKEEIDGEQITLGPKLQLKQSLGIGFQYKF